MDITRIHPETGEILTRQVRTQTIIAGDLRRDVEVPGWYPEGDGDSIHTGKDYAVYEDVLRELGVIKS